MRPISSSLSAKSLLCAIRNTPNMATNLAVREKTARMQLKTPKGTRDWTGPDIGMRDRIFASATEVFRRHAAVALDTPVFELKEILAGKYGEDARLIYDLQDQGGELCSLRYDLTVPFARWLAMNKIQQVKRYSIGKVYRRDQPAISRGRLREFYQCDVDFAGTFDPMVPDAEIISVIVEVFEMLGLADDITIKVNHRQILDGIFTVVGVPNNKIRAISSAVDKLDKSPWAEVKKEMEEKGLDSAVADDIGRYVQINGRGISSVLDQLRCDSRLTANKDFKAGLEDMDLLRAYLEAFQLSDKVSFDLSLARGLDYYTALIFEATAKFPDLHTKSNDPPIGSVAAGGRYDNLSGMFGNSIPCVGVSFGIDRIFTILKARGENGKAQSVARRFDVYVMAFGSGLLTERMALARELWAAGISAEYSLKVKPKLPQQFKSAEVGGARAVLIIGEEELKSGKVRLKILGLADDDPEKDGRLVTRQNVVSEVKKLLQ